MYATKPILALDIGNTHSTLAAIGKCKILWTTTLQTASLTEERKAKQLAKQISQALALRFERVECIGVASVVPQAYQAFVPMLEKNLHAKLLTISASVNLPFKMGYKTPQTLGADRIAAVAFAAERFPNQATIIIDFGTAITYDLLSSNAKYLGGLILASPHIVAKSLWQHTAQLPKFQWRKTSALIGRTTLECLEAGLFWSKVAETEGLIAKLKDELKKKYHETNVIVVATGGDAEQFARTIPAIDFIEKHAVLCGIRIIVEKNLSSPACRAAHRRTSDKSTHHPIKG
jgi:type III pantothenate kinase